MWNMDPPAPVQRMMPGQISGMRKAARVALRPMEKVGNQGINGARNIDAQLSPS